MNCLKLLVAATALGMATQAYAANSDGPRVSYVDKITGQTHSVLRCGTTNPSAAHMHGVEQKLREFRASDKAPLVASLVDKVVPVHFNVLTTNSGAGGVTDLQIADQLTVMNASFAGSGFTFTHAGTTRVKNTNWYQGCAKASTERAMKRGLAVDPQHTLNVYSCGLGAGLLGYATFPSYYAEDSFMHGVVILNASFPGGSAAPYNGGATTTHEVGHYLGLYHTFQGGCVDGASGGDFVIDTPASASPSSGCPVGRNSCTTLPGDDPIHNFMDYSNDACMDNFTTDQRIRMQDQVSVGRPNLGS